MANVFLKGFKAYHPLGICIWICALFHDFSMLFFEVFLFVLSWCKMLRHSICLREVSKVNLPWDETFGYEPYKYVNVFCWLMSLVSKIFFLFLLGLHLCSRVRCTLKTTLMTLKHAIWRLKVVSINYFLFLRWFRSTKGSFIFWRHYIITSYIIEVLV